MQLLSSTPRPAGPRPAGKSHPLELTGLVGFATKQNVGSMRDKDSECYVRAPEEGVSYDMATRRRRNCRSGVDRSSGVLAT